MCGIGGYVDPQRVLDGPRVLSGLAGALAHRGPDGEGFFSDGPFGLAHRRLAIIDLSAEAAQPMRVGPVVVAYNGEIYNYRELREELRAAGQRFTGVSDTEVLARAYLQWGETFSNRLRGMWAFAIFDERSRALVWSRDPFGIKPFYFTRYRGALLFASEPQALLQVGVPARANLKVAAEYLAFGVSDHRPETFFENIEQLTAGSTMVVNEAGAVRVAAREDGGAQSGDATSAAEFAAALQESVRLHLRSDVPVGTCLSGGLDSSTVAALAAPMVRVEGGPRFAAITAASGHSAADERPYAAAVAKHCDLAWHVVAPTAEDFATRIDACLRMQGEPAVSPSVYLQYCVMQTARSVGLKVMLDGQGGDELLCGYERYAPMWAREIAGQIGTLVALNEFMRLAWHLGPGPYRMTALAAYFLVPALRRRAIAARIAFLRSEFTVEVMELLERMSRGGQRLQQARVADIVAFSLPALLRFEDRNSMAHSIEARVPYVDREVVSCALRIPLAELLHDGYTKYPLRMLAARLLPASVAWRRAKVGFEPPTAAWLSPLAERMQTEVVRSTLIARLCRSPPRLRTLPLALQWRLYNLASWQRLLRVSAGDSE
jgi:asparagine synthase (glutamine-hydrolysing)